MRIEAAMVLIAVLQLGCSDASLERSSTYHFGDTLVVENAAPATPDTVRVREVARIGRMDGPLDYVFSGIFSLAVGPDGDVFVHDAGNGIRRFDPAGVFVDRIAGTGLGPGEVDYVRGMSVSTGGSAAAYDIGNNRISVLHPDRQVRTLPLPVGLRRYGTDAVTIHHDQSLWIAVPPPYSSEGQVLHPRPIFARFDEEDELVDTVFTSDHLLAKCPTLTDRQSRMGYWEDRREPYLPKMKWTLGPDGMLALGCPADYSFDLVAPDGSVTRVMRQWEPVRLQPEYRDFLAEQGMLALPGQRPAYTSILLPGDGRVWVRPTLPSSRRALPEEAARRFGPYIWDESSEAVFDVFAYEGDWLGTVRLPEEARYSGFPTDPNVVIRGDTIWAVAKDSLDVEYIVRYEVAWSGTRAAQAPR